jgi:hypothetical protein
VAEITDITPMTDERLAEIDRIGYADDHDVIGELRAEVRRARLAEKKLRATIAEEIVTIGEQFDREDQLRKQLKQMSQDRDAAVRHAERQHVPIELGDRTDTDGDVLGDLIREQLAWWAWGNERHRELVIDDVLAVVRPHLARLAEQAQTARAELAALGGAQTRAAWQDADPEEIRRAYRQSTQDPAAEAEPLPRGYLSEADIELIAQHALHSDPEACHTPNSSVLALIIMMMVARKERDWARAQDRQ